MFKDATLRQTLHMSIGADRIRIQFSNTFGGSTLPITAASLALPTGTKVGVNGIDTTTLMGLTFNGASSVTIPQGQVVYSDPIDFKIEPQSMLTVTMYTQTGQSSNRITGHPGSRTTSWMQQGNHVNASTVTGASTAHWYGAASDSICMLLIYLQVLCRWGRSLGPQDYDCSYHLGRQHYRWTRKR